jgi:8-oxo-dGTP pyrophosphatase MutT (NUDIX family)
MKAFHPRTNDDGKPVEIVHPSQPSAMAAWANPTQVATATPDAPMPESIGGIAIAAWSDAPADVAGWEKLVAGIQFEEPPMKSVSGKKPASGAVVVEADGRVWVVSPANRFGGYINTFPKGKVDNELSLRATAIKEAFEESGLRVDLTGYLCDSIRSTTVTRFYLAMRVGGNPADMCWESQATHLVPMAQLAQFVSHPNDEIAVQSLREMPSISKSDIVSYQWGLASVHRILAAVVGYRRQFDCWPKRILMDRGMFEAIPREILTPLGWKMLNEKLEILATDDGTVVAEGSQGRFEYDGNHQHLQYGPSVEFWIWGANLGN